MQLLADVQARPEMEDTDGPKSPSELSCDGPGWVVQSWPPSVVSRKTESPEVSVPNMAQVSASPQDMTVFGPS
jgi:hypothetical protein